MATATIQIKKVEIRDSNFGITNFKAPKYARVHTITIGKCLYIHGIDEENRPVSFWTPQAEIWKTDGMIAWQKLHKNVGGFFQEVKGELKGHKSPFAGDTIMPFVIEDTTEILPAVKVGETITVSFRTEESKFGSRRLKVVRLIN